MTLYGLAGELLELMAEQVQAAGVPMPSQQLVGAGPLPVWDYDIFAVHVTRMFTGQPGSENTVQGVGFTQHSAEFSVSIVRQVPIPDDYGAAPTPQVMAPFVEQNLADVEALQKGMEAVKVQGRWVDYSTPFAVMPCMTQGPEGGMLAAVISAQIQVFT